MFPTLHGLNLSLSLYYPYINFIFMFFAPLVFSQKTNLKGKKVRRKMELRESDEIKSKHAPIQHSIWLQSSSKRYILF